MKRVLLLAAVVALVCSCGDKNDEEPAKSITLENSKVTMKIGDSKQIGVDVVGLDQNSVKWGTVDGFIANVDSRGEVEAEHVGSTKVYVSADNLSDSCLVTVEGNYNTFVEPYVILGATKSEIKGLESRTLKKEDDESLVYGDSNSKVDMILYSFENGKLTGAGALLKLYVTDATELGKFYRERYDYVGESKGILLMTNGKIAVGIKVESYGISIVYIEDTVTKASSNGQYYGEAYEKIALELSRLKK